LGKSEDEAVKKGCEKAFNICYRRRKSNKNEVWDLWEQNEPLGLGEDKETGRPGKRRCALKGKKEKYVDWAARLVFGPQTRARQEVHRRRARASHWVVERGTQDHLRWKKGERK